MRKVYVADDGKQFANEYQCVVYEENLEVFGDIPFQCTMDAGCDVNPIGISDKVFAFKIRSESDLNKLNEWLVNECHAPNEFLFTLNDIGTIQIVNTFDGSDVYTWTPEELKENYCANIDRLYSDLKGENA